MEQHRSHEPEHTHIPSGSTDLTSPHPHIDRYLDRICLPLARTLSAEEVGEQRAEMRTHLEALVSAHLELGYSEAEAVRLALEQFGKERRLQNDWQNECETTQLGSETFAFLPAFRVASRAFAATFTLSGLLVGVIIFLSWGMNPVVRMSFERGTILEITLVFLPFLTGMRLGRLVHRPVGVSLLAALPTCLILPTMILGVACLMQHRLPIHPAHPASFWFRWWLGSAGLAVTTLPLAGTVGAALGQFLRRFHRRPVVS